MDAQYELETRDDSDRPLAIVRLDDASTTFTFEKKDENFAGEILDNLNAGRAWEPSLEERIEVLAESLEDSDELASSA